MHIINRNTSPLGDKATLPQEYGLAFYISSHILLMNERVNGPQRYFYWMNSNPCVSAVISFAWHGSHKMLIWRKRLKMRNCYFRGTQMFSYSTHYVWIIPTQCTLIFMHLWMCSSRSYYEKCWTYDAVGVLFCCR